MSKQAEIDYPLKVDQKHLFVKPFNDPTAVREFGFVLQTFLERIGNGSILDIGCGPGWTSLMLARAGFDVVGVDISNRMIEIANERRDAENLPVRFEVADMVDLSTIKPTNEGGEGFHGAMFFDSLHHCPDYEVAVQQSFNALRPGGFLLLMETTLLHRYSPHAKETTHKYGVTELGFSRSQLRRALRLAGFREMTFCRDPGPIYHGLSGLVKTALRLIGGHFFYAPRAKNIVLARKPVV